MSKLILALLILICCNGRIWKIK